MFRKTTMAALVAAIAILGVVVVLQTGGGADEVSAVDASYADELQNAFENGGSITLTSDVSLTDAQTISRDLEIDFNGHTISTNETITVNANLTLRDSRGGGGITANIPSTQVTDTMHCVLDNYGTMTIYGGTFNMTFQNDSPSDASTYVIRNHSNLTVYDMTIDTISNGILTTANLGAGEEATSQAITIIHDITITTGDNGYGLVVSGDDQITGTDDNEDAILTVYDATINASVCFGTNASNGLYAGFTMNILGGTYTGEYGIYCPGYGVYNISGGHFYNDCACIQIAAGILNISGDAILETDVASNTPGVVNGAIDSEGVLVIGKANQYYIGDIDVNITGGTLRNNNPGGDSIVMYDSSMGHDVFKDNTISVDITGGEVTGDVKIVSKQTFSDNAQTTPVSQNSEKLSFTLDGAIVNGDISMDEGMRTTVDVSSGVFNGTYTGPEGTVTIPEASGTVYYPDGTSGTYYFSFRMPSGPVSDRDGYTFLGFSLRSDAISADYEPNEVVETTGNVTVYEVWENDNPYVPFPDDDDDYVPIPPVVYEDSGDDDTVTIVACAAAAVVAAILAVFLIVERKH